MLNRILLLESESLATTLMLVDTCNFLFSIGAVFVCISVHRQSMAVIEKPMAFAFDSGFCF
jgi:hypothetical protein